MSAPAGWRTASPSRVRRSRSTWSCSEEVGLVSRRKQGREVLYQVQADRLDQATSAMADLVAQWDRRLVSIKRLAEETHAKAKKEQET